MRPSASAAGFISTIGGTPVIQPETAVQAIKISMIGFPILIAVILIVVLYFYKLDAEYPQIMKDLEERQKKGANKA